MNCRVLFRRLAGAPVLALGLVAAACTGSVTTPDQRAPAAATTADPLGVIAFINTGGCIERVSAGTAQPVGQEYCAASRAGVTSLTWIDADSVAYATNEARALGWQIVHFSSRQSETMPIADAPRVFLIPPQYYSPKAERLAVDAEGVVSRVDSEGDVRIFPPDGKQPDSSTRLVAWAPDGNWVLLSTSTDKELWVVGRAGDNPHRVATASKGVAAWFMPAVGATPHADLTCSVTTSQSFGCVTPLRLPLDGAMVENTADAIIDFSWSACPGATGYVFEVYGADENAPLLTTVVVGTFTHQRASALPQGELHWRVRALIGASPAPWSVGRALTILGESKR